MPGVAEAGAVNYQNVEASLMPARRLRLYVIGYEPGRPGGPQRIAEGRGIGRSHFRDWWQTARPAFAGRDHPARAQPLHRGRIGRRMR
jgi:hypothetical protein